MRPLAVLVFALSVAACGQAAPAPAASPDAVGQDRVAHAGVAPGETPDERPELAVLGGQAAEGSWRLSGDGGSVSAGFGLPEAEFDLVIGCDAGPGRTSLSWTHELAPDQDTVLRIITEAESVDLTARSFNEGIATVTAELPAGDARLAALSRRQERFALEVRGEAHVFPWDQVIARALSACAAR